MSWLDKLERKMGRFAIPGLMRVVVIGMALVFCCELLFPQALLSYYLSFIPELIAQGQVWRVFTFIFLPPESSLLFIAFALYFYYFITSRFIIKAIRQNLSKLPLCYFSTYISSI